MLLVALHRKLLVCGICANESERERHRETDTETDTHSIQQAVRGHRNGPGGSCWGRSVRAPCREDRSEMIEGERRRGRGGERERGRQGDRDTETPRHRDTEKPRHSDTETQKDRDIP